MSTVYTCADCPARISWGGQRCRSCAAKHRNSKPEIRAKMRAAAIRAQERNPEQHARFCQIGAAKLLELHEARKAAGLPHPRKGWRKFSCPPERQAEYERLRRKVGVQEAQRIILEDIETAERREARAAVLRAERAMLERHQREVESRY